MHFFQGRFSSRCIASRGIASRLLELSPRGASVALSQVGLSGLDIGGEARALHHGMVDFLVYMWCPGIPPLKVMSRKAFFPDMSETEPKGEAEKRHSKRGGLSAPMYGMSAVFWFWCLTSGSLPHCRAGCWLHITACSLDSARLSFLAGFLH